METTPDAVVGPGEEFTGETEVADVPEVVTGADVEPDAEEPAPEPKAKAKDADEAEDAE